MNEPRLNLPEVTVSELSAALRRTLEDAYGYVRVRGELGKVSYHGNGHVYFDLKDDRACIAGVIWRSTALRIQLRLEAGLEVVVSGRITTYPGRSQYQIIVDTLEPAGIGALMALLEERKRKLAAEGLFDEARKQLLPFLPGIIGVVTSPTGDVIRDILHRLADRFPRRVLLWPVKVQGEGSAAEVAVPVRTELLLDIESLSRRGLACWRRNQDARWGELRSASRALPKADGVLALPRQRLDHAAASLDRALRTNAHVHHVRFSRIAG